MDNLSKQDLTVTDDARGRLIDCFMGHQHNRQVWIRYFIIKMFLYMPIFLMKLRVCCECGSESPCSAKRQTDDRRSRAARSRTARGAVSTVSTSSWTSANGCFWNFWVPTRPDALRLMVDQWSRATRVVLKLRSHSARSAVNRRAVRGWPRGQSRSKSN